MVAASSAFRFRFRFRFAFLLLAAPAASVEGFAASAKRSSIIVKSKESALLGTRLAQNDESHNTEGGGGDDDNATNNIDFGAARQQQRVGAGETDRRRVLAATGLAALSLWLGDAFGIDNAASRWAASAAEGTAGGAGGKGRTVLITGCNSGIGFEGARILARRGGERIILACRTREKAEDAARRILAESPGADLVPAECDLTSLESVRKFASGVAGEVDAVVYNAGIALNTAGEIERTVDGFEKTVGTNHLGHFYLHHLLEPKISTAGEGGRVVITASSVHDPESPGGKQGVPATLGNLEGFSRDGANFEMVDGGPYNGDKAYKDSKLCNIFFCRELAKRLARKNIVVNAFSPGLITSSGFFRYQNAVFSSVFNVAASGIFKVAETPLYGGAALAYMTSVDGTRGEFYDSPPGTSNKYASDGDDYAGAFGKEFAASPVSKEARDEQKGRELWKLSEKLVGI